MKHIVLSALAACCAAIASAQSSDSVSLGAAYANHVWYDLETGTKTSTTNNWDLAFELTGTTASIRTNAAQGVDARLYANGDTADWSAPDTSGFSTWASLNNSDTTWHFGALNSPANLSDPFDLGWGLYNIATHVVIGNRMFVVSAGGQQYLMRVHSLAQGIFSFSLRNLATNAVDDYEIETADYSGKTFAYFTLSTGEIDSAEPLADEWQLFFGKYTTPLPGFGHYPVTGVLHNSGVKASKAYPVDDAASYVDYESHPMATAINTIGYNWKSFDNSTFQWSIADSTVYFVETPQAIWKLVFTGFSGSATGTVYFTKEKLVSLGTAESDVANPVIVYPNPSADGLFTMVATWERPTELFVTDALGKTVLATTLQPNGFGAQHLDLSHLPGGVYLAQISGGQFMKLVIR